MTRAEIEELLTASKDSAVLLAELIKATFQAPSKSPTLMRLMAAIKAVEKSRPGWDSRAPGTEDEFGFVPEPPDSARDA